MLTWEIILCVTPDLKDSTDSLMIWMMGYSIYSLKPLWSADHKVGRLQALWRAGLVRTQNIPVKLEHRAPTYISENDVFQIKNTCTDI